MKAVIYFTEIPPQYEHKNMGHMTGEKLLEEALLKEYGRKLAFEPRAKGEHGKPFFTLQPKIHYNISHSGKYVVCVLAGEEVGIDIQEHRELDYEKGLQKLVPVSLFQEILESDHIKEAFYDQWVLREAYMKWTGEGFPEIPVPSQWTEALMPCWKWSQATVGLCGQKILWRSDGSIWK